MAATDMRQQMPLSHALPAEKLHNPHPEVPSLRFTFTQPQPPSSPPLSCSEGQHDTSNMQPPQVTALTPPVSAPMSAEPSQQDLFTSLNPSSTEGTAHRNDIDGDAIMTDDGLEPLVQISAKRKLLDDGQNSEPNKRRRTDHDRAEEETVAALKNDGSKAAGFSPLYKLCSNRKGSFSAFSEQCIACILPLAT